MTAPIVLLSPAVLGDWAWTWTDPEGGVHSLSDPDGVMLASGADGLRFPPSQQVEDVMPFAAGSRLRRVKTQARTLTFPLLIQDPASSGALFSWVRAVGVWFDPTRGDGVLTSTAPDGEVRQVTGRLLNDLSIQEDVEGKGGPAARIAVVQLRVVDPFWTDAADTTLAFSLGSGSVPFFPWHPYFSLNASSLFATSAVLNDGDVPCDPIWTISGPGINPVITNLTTGARLSLTRTLALGDTLSIDTRTNRKSVVDASGNNLFAALSADSAFFQLARGLNLIQVEMSGASVASAVTLVYRQKFHGP